MNHAGPDRRGLSLVEVTVSMIVISVMLTAALSTLGATSRTEVRSVERLQGRDVAEQLMAEIRGHAYEEQDATPAFGPEADESTANRLEFDDVDDYDGWKSSPPTDVAGLPSVPGAGWARRVDVAWVRTDDPTAESGSETGLKRIVVTVSRDGRRVAVLESFAGDVGRDRRPEVTGAVDGSEPRAAFTVSARSGPAPLEVTVDATPSADPRGQGLNWRWTFGDGAVETTKAATHEYASPGTYTLSLRVTDDLGRAAIRSLIIVVEDP